MKDRIPSLIEVLRVDLILQVLAPFLPFPDIQNLSSVNKASRLLLRDNPSAYRRLDLSISNGTTSEVFSRLIDSSRGLQLLTYARVLILDTQSIDEDFLRDLLLSGNYQVRILSIAGCIGFDYAELRSIITLLNHHAELIPEQRSLRGLYIFEYLINERPSPVYKNGILRLSTGTECEFYPSSISTRAYRSADTLTSGQEKEDVASQMALGNGSVMYNAVLCRGPRHSIKHPKSIGHRIADYIIGPQGCSSCGTLPEGPASDPRTDFPLISPPPFSGFSTAAAARPPLGIDGKPLQFFARCGVCSRDSVCESCKGYYCEKCNESSADTGGPKATIVWPAGVRVQRCGHCIHLCVACVRASHVHCHDCDMLFCKLGLERSRALLVELPEELDEIDLVSEPLKELQIVRATEIINGSQCYICFFNRARVSRS